MNRSAQRAHALVRDRHCVWPECPTPTERVELMQRRSVKACYCLGMRACDIDDCRNPHYGRGWCSKHYKRWKKTGDPATTLWETRSTDRFWAKVKRGEGCWEWTAYKDPLGYGRLTVNRESWLAHRRSWVLSGRTFPQDRPMLDHLCRNPSCVRPDHLEPVTMQENIKRGRPSSADLRRAATHCKHGHPFSGENTYRSPTTGLRSCRTCRRRWRSEWQQRQADPTG